MGVGNNYYELQVVESELETEVMYYQGGTGRFAMREPMLRIVFLNCDSSSYVLYGSSEPRPLTWFLLPTPHIRPIFPLVTPL